MVKNRLSRGILAARRLAQFDSGARVPATVSAIADAIRWAERNWSAVACQRVRFGKHARLHNDSNGPRGSASRWGGLIL